MADIPKKTNAKTLFERYFGSDYLSSIPAKWKAGLRYFIDKTPGVPNGTEPDTVEGEIVASQVTTNRTDELEKQTTRLDANLLTGAVAHGQQYDEKLGVPKPFAEYLTLDNAEVGQAGRDINPLNPTLSEVRKFDTSAVAEALADIVLLFPGSVNLRYELPPVLTGIDVIVESSSSEGDYVETSTPATNAWFLPNLRQESIGRSQGGATILASVIPYMRHPPHGRIRTTQALFFLPMPVTEAAVIAKLTSLLGDTINPWPKFDATQAFVKVTGQRLALEVNTKVGVANTAIVIDPLTTIGKGKSQDKTMTVHIAELPQSIHDEVIINVIGSLAASVVVHSHSEVLPYGNADPTVADLAVTGEIVATVEPRGFAPTNVRDVPDSGLYAFPSTAEPYISTVDNAGAITRFAMIHGEVLDMADVPRATAGAPIP